MARGKTHLKKRGDIYWVRFQYTDALRESACNWYGVESWPTERSWSLRVTTLVEAEAAAARFIADHKDLVAFSKACNDPVNHWANIRKAWLMEPGTMVVLEDGSEIVADQHSIITITPDKKLSSKPNRQLPIVEYTDYGRTTPEVKAAHAARCALEKVRDIDAEVIEAYIADRRKRGKFQADDDPNALRRTLADFKAINGGKTISQSARKDVEALIEYLLDDRDPQLSPARVKKLLSYVRAAVNFDIQQNQATPNFRYNIFDNFLYLPTPIFSGLESGAAADFRVALATDCNL